MTDDTARRARREFIRRHHPDAGGDPVQFIAELARLDEALGYGSGSIRVVGRARPALPRRVAALLRRHFGAAPPPRVR